MHSKLYWDSAALPLADESVDTIITDPPWSFDLRVSTRAKAVRATDYALMTDLQLKMNMWELARVLKPGGHLFMFVPDQKLEAAIDCMKDSEVDWCRFASAVWVKTTNDEERVRMGLGHTFRMCHEMILGYGKGYRRPFQHHSLASVQGYARTAGSVKPDELYIRLVLASTPRYGTVLDPWAGSDPLGRANLEDYRTISGDISWSREWKV